MSLALWLFTRIYVVLNGMEVGDDYLVFISMAILIAFFGFTLNYRFRNDIAILLCRLVHPVVYLRLSPETLTRMVIPFGCLRPGWNSQLIQGNPYYTAMRVESHLELRPVDGVHAGAKYRQFLDWHMLLLIPIHAIVPPHMQVRQEDIIGSVWDYLEIHSGIICAFVPALNPLVTLPAVDHAIASEVMQEA
ncbi:uncharacterized protein BCR38DRAFT_473916 [Pseudomassariella vexata]|uniref:Uncharacterized protein n=1 Tax=Pseudomassariella vexata TaxID=1141098 RepID=A0A1Y2E0A2_9PEZI|nr:uncharacterized protein BCR38DRAFT_473916 [Pseudomassariella vexata]ORY64909.1 hypothetical protein BCR38DRAFT_473916 [Pseudomassariella vexata]